MQLLQAQQAELVSEETGKVTIAEGAKVVICGRRAEKGQEVVDSIVKEG